MTDKSLVIQHNKIIEAKYRLSVGEQRLIKLLVSMISRDDEDFKPYQIRVADLADLLGIKSGDIYPAMKKSTKKLIGNVLTFESLDGEESIQTAWLSSARYLKGQGIAELQFSPILKPFLLQLQEHFTAYELGNVINLKHTYSIRIYELLKQYERIGHRKFTVEKLRELLVLEENEYKQFCDFRRWILKPAQKELGEKTDISFEWKEERRKQKCVSIEFIIIKQSRHTNTQKNLIVQEVSKVIECLSETLEIEPEQKAIIDLLLESGVSPEMAKELANDYTKDEIQAAVIYTETLRIEGKIKNPAGFLVDAIRKGFRDNHAEERKKKEEASKKQQELLRHQEKWNYLKKAFQAAVSEEALRQYEALGEEEKKTTWNTFYAAQTPLARKLIDRDREGVPTRGFFLAYLKSTLKLLSFTEWAQAHAVSLVEFQAEMRRENLVA